MQEFDIDSYLANIAQLKSSLNIPETRFTPIPGYESLVTPESEYSKSKAIVLASEQKRLQLLEQSVAKQNKLRQESEKSLIGRLGLEYDSTLGAGLNAIAGGASDVSRMLGEGFAAIPSLGAQSLEQNIDPKSMDILKRKSAGAKITPEEEQWINTPIADIYDPSVLNGPTPQQMFDGKFGFERTRKFANEMRDATDISSIVNNESIGRMAIEQSENKPLQEALKRLATPDITSWKKEDLTLAIKSVFESGANNPLAVTQAIAQNLPSLALAIVSPQALIAANVGYAQTNYDKWSENFAKRENREPTEQEKKEAQANAFSLAAAETAGDLLTAGAAKTLKGSLGFGSKAAGAVTPQALKEALGVVGKTAVGQAVSKAAPAVANATKAATKVLGAMGAEFGTEGYQTSTEQLLEKGERADAEEVFFGGTLGALSSGGITSAASGLGLAADVIDVATASQKQTAEDKKAKDAVFKSAVETGDVSSFVSDKNVLKNNWVNAAQALVENSKLENKTEEDIKNNINKIDEELIFDLEDKIQVLSLDTDKKVDILNGFIKDRQEELNADPTNEKLKQSINSLIAQRDAPLDSKKESASNKIISKLQQQLNEVVNLREGLAAQTVVGEASVLNDAKAITQASTTDSTDGTVTPAVDVSGFVARAMKVRGPKTQEMADALTAVADSGKATPEEVNTLRILAAEIVASNKAKNAKGVSNDVFNGTGPKAGTTPRPGRDFMGVFTYQKKFDEATAKNNKEEANKNFNNLKAFTENHKAKLAAFKSLKPGEMAVVNKQGNWIITSIDRFNNEKNALKFAKNNGGFAYVGPNPKNLIASIEDEISIMEPVLAKMALELGKQPKPKEQGSVSQTVETKQAEEKRQEVSESAIVDPGKEQADAGIVESTENEKLINETETDLSQDETESVAETTAQSESEAISDDTPGNGAGVNTDSDKLNEQEPTIVEDKKYTSKQEVLKAIKKKKEAFVNFINCL